MRAHPGLPVFTAALLALATASACGAQSPTPAESDPGGGSAPPDQETADAAPPAADAPPSESAPSPDAAPATSGEADASTQTGTSACRAAADECCRADGTIVRPGGCQPSYPDGVAPATRRGNDGFCERIPCYKKCLPLTATIATPTGAVPLSSLEVGDLVWTADAGGRRVAAPIRRIGRAPVLAPHHILEVELDDGRVVRGSAGHPTGTGAPLGELRTGTLLDGTRVRAVRRLPYRHDHTGDLLPAGPTGIYWSNGVPLRSTLINQ